MQSKKAAHTRYFLPQMHVNLTWHFGAYSCRLEMTAWQFANCVYIGSPQQVGLCSSVSVRKCVTCVFSDVAAFVRGTVRNHTPVRSRTHLQPGTAVHVCCHLVPGFACSLCRSVCHSIMLHLEPLHVQLERKLINESNKRAVSHLSCLLHRQSTVATRYNEVQITN